MQKTEVRRQTTDNRQQKTEARGKLFLVWLLTSVFCLLVGCAERSPYKYYNIYTLVEPEVIKNGIKQPPSYDKESIQEIQAKTELNDLIVPIENIEFMEEWTWYVRPLFNQTDEEAIKNRGKIFSISMPIEIDGNIIDYNYKFRIDHVVPQSTWVY